jgi:hypothetical protein
MDSMANRIPLSGNPIVVFPNASKWPIEDPLQIGLELAVPNRILIVGNRIEPTKLKSDSSDLSDDPHLLSKFSQLRLTFAVGHFRLVMAIRSVYRL